MNQLPCHHHFKEAGDLGGPLATDVQASGELIFQLLLEGKILGLVASSATGGRESKRVETGGIRGEEGRDQAGGVGGPGRDQEGHTRQNRGEKYAREREREERTDTQMVGEPHRDGETGTQEGGGHRHRARETRW